MNTTTRRILAAGAATGAFTLATAVPAAAKPEWTEHAAVVGATTSEPRVVTREVFVDDDAWEYLQIGIGALAGVTFAGAAAAAIRRRGEGPQERAGTTCRWPPKGRTA